MDLEALRTFVAVVDSGSFSAAARSLGVSKSTVSERVNSLEESLGLSLMHRSTRKFRLSERGDELYRRGQDIMREAAEAERAMSADADRVVGRVRLSAPVSLGVRYLGPLLARLSGEFPQLELEADLSDAPVDLLEQPYDLALRVGTITQPGLIASKLGEFRRLVVGSPGYLDDHGCPRAPAELSGHRCLRFAHQKNPALWSFSGGTEAVRVEGPLMSNNGDLIAAAAEAGAGLAWLPEFIVREAMEQKRLLSVLDRACDELLPLHLVFSTRRYLPARVRAVSDSLRAHCRSLMS